MPATKSDFILYTYLPGFSALPGFKAPFYGDGQSALNPGTTVFDIIPLIVVHALDLP